MRLPPGTDVQLEEAEGTFFVFAAAPPLIAGPHLFRLAGRPGGMTMILTHDAGVSWPDREGVLLGEAALDQGGAVIMQFETRQDALAARRWLLREMAHG